MRRNWDFTGENQYPGAAGGGNFAQRRRTAPFGAIAQILASTVAIIVVATR